MYTEVRVLSFFFWHPTLILHRNLLEFNTLQLEDESGIMEVIPFKHITEEVM